MRIFLLATETTPPPGTAIRPPSWWAAKASIAGDLSSFSKYITTDSFDHYTLGLGVCGCARMGEALGSQAWYDQAYYYLMSIMALSVPVAGGYQGWYGATRGGGETSLDEIYCWRFAPDLLLPTSTIPSYQPKHDAVKAFLERNIWTKWYSRNNSNGVPTNLYRSVLHIASHWAKLALYLRTEGSTATIRSQADTVCAAISHAGMPNWGMANMYSQIRKYPHPTGGSDTAFWPAYWTGTLSSEPYGSDTQHGVAIGTFLGAALRAGYGPWSVSTDLPRFIRLRDIFTAAPGSPFWATLSPGGTFEGSTTWAGKMAEYGSMAQHDRDFQSWLEADEARHIGDNSEKWGTFALNALRLGGPYL